MLHSLLPGAGAIDPAMIAGIALWALALYWGFSPLAQHVMDQLNHWLMGLRESFLSTVSTDSELAPDRSKSQPTAPITAPITALASLLSIVPFLVLGGLTNYGLNLSLGGSWAISTGLIACMGGGIYELGRQDSKDREPMP